MPDTGEQSITTDVLIIGAGAVGCTFARLLVAAGRKVTLVDAGKQLSSRPGEHLKNAFRYQQLPNLFAAQVNAFLEYYSVPENIFPWNKSTTRDNFENPEQKWYRNMPIASAIYAVGGMTVLWSNATPDPEPWERTPLISDQDWETSLKIGRALLNVHSDVFDHSVVGQVIWDKLVTAGYNPSVLPLAAEKMPTTDPYAFFTKWSAGDTVLGPLADLTRFQNRFQLLEEHRGEQLCYTGQKIDSVIVRDLKTFTTKRVYADTVIVASGSFFTPRLLWMSGIRYDALGRFLNDHLEVSMSVKLSSDIMDTLRGMESNPARNDDIPVPLNDPGPAFTFAPTPEKPWRGKVERFGEKMFYLPTQDVRKSVQLTYYGTTDIVPDNRVMFSEKYFDRFDMPQVTIDFSHTWSDRGRILKMLIDLYGKARQLGRPGIPIISPPGTTQHLMGTYRMGNDGDQKTSVIDPDGKVWGFDNLYLGGLGVIPNQTASNPTLTACSIAARTVSKIINCSLDDVLHSVTALT